MDIDGGAARARHRLGKYELLEEVGRGGMGVVYRAFDHSLQRMVAVKVLRDKLLNHPLLISRFQREAKAAASLNHPNIVQIYSVGWLDDVLHIAMEFIEGASLAQLMEDQRRIAWKHALDFGQQVASALACAHKTGIIHRDVKLTNILIDPNGRAYVTDFGIAKVLTADTQLTVQGERLGTPQYMAPERFSGGEVTPSSDLYSLGVVLFQLISGRLPYEANSQVSLIKKIASDPPARLRDYVPSVPEDVERLVAYLIEKRPKNRPDSAEDVCEAIARVRAGKPLDDGPSYAPSALAEFRESLAKVRRRPATPAPRQKTPTSGRLHAATTRWGQRWATVPKWIRLGMLVGAVAMAGAYSATLVLSNLRGDPALAAIAQANGEVERWSQSPVVAEFVKQSPDEITARVNLDGFGVSRGAWVDGQLVVELRGLDDSPRRGQHAICTLEPDAETALLTFAPHYGDTAKAWAAASRTPGSGPMQELTEHLVDSLESRLRLTHVEGGCATPFFLSEDGAWAAAARQSAEQPCITFVKVAPAESRVF